MNGFILREKGGYSMSDQKPLQFSKLAPYDASKDVNMTMYDRLPYVRNHDACNAEHIAMVSGNILKYYRLQVTDSCEIDNQDSTFRKRVEDHMKKQPPKQEVVDLGDFSEDFPDRGLTEEQMNELFKDDPPKKSSEIDTSFLDDDDWE